MSEGGTQIEMPAAAKAYNKGLSKSQHALIGKLKNLPIVGKFIEKSQAAVLNIAEAAAGEDSLTGLDNRFGAETKLKQFLAMMTRDQKTDPDTVLAVYFIDANKLKPTNDNLGHPAGDGLLVGVAEAIRQSSVRQEDILARISGDEFVIIGRIKKENQHDNKLVDLLFKNMDKLREELATNYPQLPKGSGTLSVGRQTLTIKQIEELIEINPTSDVFNLVTKGADDAMYKAKTIAHETHKNEFIDFNSPEDLQKDKPLSPAQPPQEQG